MVMVKISPRDGTGERSRPPVGSGNASSVDGGTADKPNDLSTARLVSLDVGTLYSRVCTPARVDGGVPWVRADLPKYRY